MCAECILTKQSKCRVGCSIRALLFEAARVLVKVRRTYSHRQYRPVQIEGVARHLRSDVTPFRAQQPLAGQPGEPQFELFKWVSSSKFHFHAPLYAPAHHGPCVQLHHRPSISNSWRTPSLSALSTMSTETGQSSHAKTIEPEDQPWQAQAQGPSSSLFC